MLTTTLRLPDDLERAVRVASASRRQTLHAWVLAAIRAAVLRQATTDPAVAAAIGGERA